MSSSEPGATLWPRLTTEETQPVQAVHDEGRCGSAVRYVGDEEDVHLLRGSRVTIGITKRTKISVNSILAP